MIKIRANDTEAAEGCEPSPPPYNTKLDPDNATSPLAFDERREEGRELFFPEGGPEDPPVRDFQEEYDLSVGVESAEASRSNE